MTVNAHYVPRFLTRPWETEDRKLVYYDFSRRTILRNSSKKVLARLGLNSATTEAWFSPIEARAAAARTELINECIGRSVGLRDADDLDDLLVLCALQLHRSGVALLPDHSLPSLEIHAAEVPAWTNLIADAVRNTFVHFVRFDNDTSLHFPECGYFMIANREIQNDVFVFPLTPHMSVFRARRDGNIEWLSVVFEKRALLTALSVGHGPLADRVIVPPDFSESLDDHELTAHMLELRGIASAFATLSVAGQTNMLR